MLQENEKEHNDVIDFLTDACKVVKQVKTPEGKLEEQSLLDPERVYWKTQNINSDYFGRAVLELKQLEACAFQAFFHMSKPRAEVIAEQITSLVNNYKYSIDAKNSETMRDRRNSQQSLVGMLSKNKSERVYTVKGDKQRTIGDMILGRDVEKEEDER